jgi:hypothetical protein
MTDRRKAAHAAHLERITRYAHHYYHAPPHPNEIAAAQAQLKRGIDEDWQASVQRYPEVLEYFYSLVELTLPNDSEPAVKDPPLSALNGGNRKRSMPTLHDREMPPLPRRTPPPPSLEPRRTPAPRGGGRRYAPPPPGSYYGPPYA